MTNITRINGHPSNHALDQLRNARAQVANALLLSMQHLQMAHMTARMHALDYDPPSDKELGIALEAVNRDLHRTPTEVA